MKIGTLVTKPLQVSIAYPDGITQNFNYPERTFNVERIVHDEFGRRIFITDESMTSLFNLAISEDLVQEYIPCDTSLISATPSIGATPN